MLNLMGSSGTIILYVIRVAGFHRPSRVKKKEPNYSAGLILHPLHLNTVYLSRKINGIFEIEKWVTKNHGQDWTSTTITANSKYDNVRPFIPRNMRRKDKTMLLWMVNEKYIHYTDYKTSINFIIE